MRVFQDYIFDPVKAARACRFIETCCYLYKGDVGAGRPLKLRPWQRTIIEELFGWVHKDTGLRRYRKSLIFLPRKTGKSSLSGAIALYMLYGDNQPGAEVILAANSREQASIVYRNASEMVRQSPALIPLSKVIDSTKRIIVSSTSSILKVVSAEAPQAFGMDISALIYDEIAFAPSRDLYDALKTSGGSRKQPLQIYITTAGWDVQGIGYELYRYAKTVLSDPASDPSFLPIVYEADGQDDWTKESTWAKANPALGDFRMLEELRADAREAINAPSNQNTFKMLYLNRWIQAAESWLDVEKWKSCRTPEPDLSGKPCYVGLDLSSNIDFSALVALFDLGNRQYYVKPYLFLPGDDLRTRVLKDHAPYDAWAEQNHIILTDGPTIDYSFIRATLDDIAAHHEVKAVGFDPWHAHQFIEELDKAGYNTIKIRQGHESLGAPTQEFETHIIKGAIHHDGNPCLTWMVGNAVPRFDANANIVPDKKRSRNRIDGVSASVFALCCAMKLEEPVKKPVEFRATVLG